MTQPKVIRFLNFVLPNKCTNLYFSRRIPSFLPRFFGAIGRRKFKFQLLLVQVGLTYKIEVFVAERFPCHSEFLFEASNMTFVSAAEQSASTPAVDYIVTLNETLHVNGSVQEMLVADAFSTGLFCSSVFLFFLIHMIFDT